MRNEMKAEQVITLPIRAVARLVDFVHHHPVPVLIAAFVTAILSVALATTRLEYHTQRTDLVGADKEYLERWHKYLDEFGDEDDMVVVVQGQDRERMKQALDELGNQVASQPEHFDRLFYKVDLRDLHNRALLFLSSDQICQIQDNLRSMSMLLEPPLVKNVDPLFGWKSLTMKGLLHEARLRAGRINPDCKLSKADDQFFTQLNNISKSATAYYTDPDRYSVPWHSLLVQEPEQKNLIAEPQYFFSGDGTLAFLLARPIKESGSFVDSSRSVEAMRGVVRDVSARYPDLELGLTGLPVLESDEMVASLADTKTASWLALIGVAFLYLIVFRTFRHPFLTLMPLLVGTAWALGWLTLTLGHLNILSATFGVMLLGMGDYGVLWVTRFDQERRGGLGIAESLSATAEGVGPGILTAAATTALAFFAAMFADFQAVAELGWIAGSGVLLCALATFTVLPALLTLVERSPRWRMNHEEPRDTIPITSADVWLPSVTGRPRWVLAIGLASTVILGTYALQIRYDHNLLNLQAKNLDSVKWEMTLIDHTAGASWHALSYTDTPEEALALKARFEQLPVVSRVVEVASLVPPDQESKLEQMADIQRRLRYLPERGKVIPHALPNMKHVKMELDCLIGALQPLADTMGHPLLADLRVSLRALRDTLMEQPAVTATERMRQFEQRMAGDLAEDLHQLRDVSTPRPIEIADLPRELRERYLGTNGSWLVQAFGRESLWEYEPLGRFVEQIQSVDPDATGKPFATLEGLKSMKEGFEWAGVYALIAIITVLMLDFRKPLRVAIALTPLCLGVVMTLGIMSLAGLPLNPANMIALPLIVGVGVDNGVHVMHDFLSRRSLGRYRLSCTIGRGIMVAALTTILGFGMLMISHHRGLFGLGLILTLGVACSMITALVILPAALRLLGHRCDSAKEAVVRPVSRAA